MLVGSTSSFPTANVWRDALLAIFRTITNGMWDVGDCWNAAAPMEANRHVSVSYELRVAR
jgi:hypothetical protein